MDSDRYFTCLVAYIHRNPQRHGFVEDFRDWPFSSYKAVLSTRATRVQRQKVLDWFDGRTGFEQVHRLEPDEAVIEPVMLEG